MKETNNDYLVNTQLTPNSTSEQLIKKAKEFCIYFITNTILDKHYIGYSSRLGPYPINNLGVNGIKYCSSSTDESFKKDQKENPNNYFYSVIDSFDTIEEALALEIELHNRYNVRVNESFYNRAKQSSTGFDTTGMHHTVETRKLQSDAKIGRKHTNETKKKISINGKGKNKGRKKSDEEKKKMSIAALNMSNEAKNQMSISAKNRENSPNAKKINIYNNINELMFKCYGNFEKICRENNLPFSHLKKSYQNNEKLLFLTKNEYSEKFKHFIGWYDRVI